MDTWYLDNLSIRLDLKILVLAVPAVCRRHGFNADGQTTALEFLAVNDPVASQTFLGGLQELRQRWIRGRRQR